MYAIPLGVLVSAAGNAQRQKHGENQTQTRLDLSRNHVPELPSKMGCDNLNLLPLMNPGIGIVLRLGNIAAKQESILRDFPFAFDFLQLDRFGLEIDPLRPAAALSRDRSARDGYSIEQKSLIAGLAARISLEFHLPSPFEAFEIFLIA